MNPAPTESGDPGSSDLGELIDILWKRRLWIAGGTILFALLAAGAAFWMTPIYRASTVLVAADADRSSLGGALGSALGSLGGIAALADIGVGSNGAATDEALAVLRSRQFADEFIADRQLMPIIFASKWSPEAHRWKVPPGDQPTASKAFEFFDRRVRNVMQDKKTGLITLQVDWKDPKLAAAWANEMVQRLNVEMKRRALLQADASIGYLEKELTTTNVLESRNAINRLIETQINRRMVANVSEQFAFRVVDRAVPADLDDAVRPKKLVMILSGGGLGLLMSCVLVLIMRSRVVVDAAH